MYSSLPYVNGYAMYMCTNEFNYEYQFSYNWYIYIMNMHFNMNTHFNTTYISNITWCSRPRARDDSPAKHSSISADNTPRYTHICEYTFTYIGIHAYIMLGICILSTGAIILNGIHMCAYIYMYICTYLHTYIHVYICIYMYICTCMNVYIYM